jgi:MATE family multidrug resistance protein
MVLNSVQPVVSGVAVGGGWQGLVAYINLGCYYIFGLPLGYLLGYKFNFGVGVILTTACFFFLAIRRCNCCPSLCCMNETHILILIIVSKSL